MNDKAPSLNNTPPVQELSDTLRPAVEQVRAAAPPAEVVERAIDRGQKLGPPPQRRSRRWLAYSAAAVIVVALGAGFALWPNRVREALAPDTTRQEYAKLAPKPQNTEERAPDALMMKQLDDVKDEPSNTIFTQGELKVKASNTIHQRAKSLDRNGTGDKAKKMPAGGGAMPGKGGPGGPQANGPQATQWMMNPHQGYLQGAADTSPARVQPQASTARDVGQAGLPHPGAMPPPAAFRRTITEGVEQERAPVPDPERARQQHIERDLGRSRGDQSGGRGEGRLAGGMGLMGMGGGMGMNGGMMGMSGVPRMGMGGGVAGGQGGVADSRKAALGEVQKLRKQFDEITKSLDSVTPEEFIEARRKLKDAETKLKAIEARESDKKQQKQQPQKKQPQVWHRDRSRPAFARVYVGDGNSLELVSLHVSVTIEGPRARTVVDHIFRNPHNRQLEGTFEYPLPTGASPSYFAMFLGQTRETVPALFGRRGEAAPLPAEALARMTPEELVKHVDVTDWGRLQQGRIVSKEKALETYEEVVRGRIDPALLEYSGGNTFSGRVFPIPAKGYNRVILAYEELLPFAQDHMLYRFPLPGRKLQELQFSLQANAAECLQPAVTCSDSPANRQRKLPGEERGGRITFTRIWKDSEPQGEVLFACTPAHPDVQAVSGRQGDNGPRYVYARLRPALKTVANSKPFASHAVFLVDTSLSEHPDRFAVNVKLLRKILETDTDIKQFNILTFNVGAAWLDAKGCFDNTAAGRERALKKLDGIVLEGATDISCALDKLAVPAFDLKEGTPLNVFLLSDGHITWGEPDAAALVARFEQQCLYPTRFHCYRTGLGEENSELFEALTRRGGGVFQCYSEAELEAAAKAHRSQCLQVQRVRFVGGPQASDVLVSGRRAAVYPGGELVVAARFNGTGRTTVLLEGEFAGQKMVQEFPLEVRSDSELTPRAWAEVAVASLLGLHDGNFDALVTAYCQQFGIVSRVASFLVLENEADYKRFNLEEERGRTVAGDLGEFIAETWKQLGKRTSAAKAFERFLNQVDKRVNLLNGPEGAHVRQLLSELTEADYALPAGSVLGGLIYQKDVVGYLEERERDRRNVGAYLTEARRRAESGDVDSAVRVLSSIIEEFPCRGDALRLVGYRLLDLQQPAQAARLFSQVQKQRPFEPHSYRDLAHALEQSEHYGLAAINYEIVLAGTWHNRFRQELKLVAQEEYAHMMQEAIRRKHVSSKLANRFGERLEQMIRPQPKSDLRVTISWNTDATDIDLWVIEPDGTKCFYQHNRTQSGGELSQDQTQGYGPERYQIAKAQPGVYTILVHYFAVNPNLLGGETHVRVTVTRFAGTPQEKSERHTVILKQHNQQVEVGKVKF